jgi:hypothetical protein
VPYQQTATTSFTIGAEGANATVVTTMTLPSLAMEVEQISVKTKAPSGAYTLMSADVATRLHNSPAVHGLRDLQMSASAPFEGSWSQVVKLYADGASALTFTARTTSNAAGAGQLEWSVSGKLVTPSCWFAPQQ